MQQKYSGEALLRRQVWCFVHTIGLARKSTCQLGFDLRSGVLNTVYFQGRGGIPVIAAWQQPNRQGKGVNATAALL
jgi:hypothetical protein